MDLKALAEIRELLGDAPRRRDLLIEFPHRIQDRYHHISVRHILALGEEMKLPLAEIYEVATFYQCLRVAVPSSSTNSAVRSERLRFPDALEIYRGEDSKHAT